MTMYSKPKPNAEDGRENSYFRRYASKFAFNKLMSKKSASLGIGLGIGLGALCLALLGFPGQGLTARSSSTSDHRKDEFAISFDEDGFTNSQDNKSDLSHLILPSHEAKKKPKHKFDKYYNKQLKNAINTGKDLVQRVKDEYGAPGFVVGVSIDGKNVWEEGFGYADVENRVPCTKDTVLRIASISKSITMTALAKLWEKGLLDLDKPVQEYVPHFPEKMVDGEKVTITTRHLVSHLSGIRHYDKSYLQNHKQESGQQKAVKDEKETKAAKDEKKEAKDSENKTQENGTKEKKKKDEFVLSEYFLKEKFETTKSALDLFKDDPLVHKPGTKYLYTTHGWTLVSAVIEAVAKEPFTKHITRLFSLLGMKSTYLDLNDTLIYNRARNYCKDKAGKLVNTPYVDNSYKWAGGGFLSTVGDLLRFGNAMLYSFQCPELNLTTENSEGVVRRNLLPGYLKQSTVKMMWSPISKSEPIWDKEGRYGMGWGVTPEKQECGFCKDQRFYVSHTGGAIGASSVLLILPDKSFKEGSVSSSSDIPKGVVVVLIANMQNMNLSRTALKIAEAFEGIEVKKNKRKAEF